MSTLKPDLPLYVIADLHLGGGAAATETLFYSFLESLEPEANSLLILGDLFEVWVGDDIQSSLARRVASRLSRLSQTGTEIFFVHGNRDFLIGDEFATSAGMTLLDEPIIVTNASPATGFVHGDRLCTADEKFQRFREKSRSPAWQRKMLSLPRFPRQWLGQFARWRSQRHGVAAGRRAPQITDVTPEAVEQLMTEHGLTRLVHGHTHRLAIHGDVIGPQTERWVLGDWHGHAGSVLILTESELTLHRISLTPEGTVTWSEPLQPLAR